MGKLRALLDRVTGRGGNAEADVQADPARADSREPGGAYVGRAGADDDFAGETGAEKREARGEMPDR